MDISVGWVLTLAPAGLIAWGLLGVVLPAVWHPIVAAGGNNWYAFIHVTSPRTAWLSVPLGLAFCALGRWAGPRLLRGYGTLAQDGDLDTVKAAALRLTGQMDANCREVFGHKVEEDLHS